MIDFEYWKELYKDDPEDFDRQRDLVLSEELEKTYEKDSPEYNKMIAIITTVNKEVAEVDGAEAKLNVMQQILKQHAEGLSEGMTKLKEAVEEHEELNEDIARLKEVVEKQYDVKKD